MQEKWVTKTQDLESAQRIINKHLELNEGGPLGIMEVFVGEKTTIHLAEWVVELIHFFVDKYGIKQGDFVIKKILSLCLVNGETVH